MWIQDPKPPEHLLACYAHTDLDIQTNPSADRSAYCQARASLAPQRLIIFLMAMLLPMGPRAITVVAGRCGAR